MNTDAFDNGRQPYNRMGTGETESEDGVISFGATPQADRGSGVLDALLPVRVAFVVGGLHREASGVARIVCDLANAMSRRNASVRVYTAKCKGHQIAHHLLEPACECISRPGWWAGRLAYSPALRRLLEIDARELDVFHNHSLWMLPNHYASKAAHQYKKPAVFTLHGFLEPWAFARSGWKKRLAGSLFQNRDLKRAACIHVNSPEELRTARHYGLRSPVAIVPNGVDLPPSIQPEGKSSFFDAYSSVRGKRVCLFLSRLHEKKGLAHLVDAWARLVRRHGDWHLVIAGPDDGYELATRRRISEHGLEEQVTLLGPLFGEQKQQALAAASLFALPSFSEGFSMAILEAMAARLPVLATPGCNFPELARRGAGTIVEPVAEDTARGLDELLALSDQELQEMGARGREMVMREYTWDSVAARLLDLYRWLVAGGSRPGFVEVA